MIAQRTPNCCDFWFRWVMFFSLWNVWLALHQHIVSISTLGMETNMFDLPENQRLPGLEKWKTSIMHTTTTNFWCSMCIFGGVTLRNTLADIVRNHLFAGQNILKKVWRWEEDSVFTLCFGRSLNWWMRFPEAPNVWIIYPNRRWTNGHFQGEMAG